MTKSNPFHEFLSAQAGELYTFVYFLCGNSVEALGLLEQSFYQFLSRFDRMPPEREALYTLYQLCLKAFRRVRKEAPSDLLTDPSDLKTNLLDQILKKKDLLQQRGFQRTLSKIILALPFDLKVPLLLRDTFGFQTREIAALLHLPETTVGYRLVQARERLIHALRSEPTITAH